jgi:hypothetical protein
MSMPAANTPLDASQLAARTQRAVDAATAAGRELGLEVTDAAVLHDAFSVVVHLAPAAVVVRVPVVLPHGFDGTAQRARQVRELALVAWLADTGQPVVRPSPLVPREPVQRSGFSMTFWEKVELDAGAAPDYVADARLVPALHAALRDYRGELPLLAPLAATIPNCLAFLDQRDDLMARSDLQRAQREWAVLAPLLASREGFSAAFPGVTLQALHGDAPAYNMMRTTAGLRHADFEDVCLGPPEWDLAGFGPDAAAAYDAAAASAGVRALDREALRVMDCARMLQSIACFALVPQLPPLAGWLAPSLEQWRAMPFAGGLANA